MTANRKLAAILAADVVGYSRLMQADETGTLTALKQRRTDILEPLVARFCWQLQAGPSMRPPVFLVQSNGRRHGNKI